MPIASLRTYVIPARVDPAQATLVVLHGLGDSSAGWAGAASELRLPGLEFILADAPDPYYDGYAWYDFYGDQAGGIRRSRGLLHKLIAEIERRGTPAAKIAILGFSQGCVMALDAGLRYPKRLGALVGISGYVFEPEALVSEIGSEARSVPALITHGTADPLLPIGPSRKQAAFLKAAGLDVTWQEFAKAHTVAGETEFKVIRDFLSKSLGLGRG